MQKKNIKQNSFNQSHKIVKKISIYDRNLFFGNVNVVFLQNGFKTVG